MPKNNTNNENDRVGLEYLMKEKLLFRRGGIFISHKGMDVDDIDDAVEKYGIEEAQKYWNHIHMVSYSPSVSTQRVLGWEIVDAFRQQVNEKNLVMFAELRDDDFDIEVTFWIPDEKK